MDPRVLGGTLGLPAALARLQSSRRAKSYIRVLPGSRSSVGSGFIRLALRIPRLARRRRTTPQSPSEHDWLEIERLALQQAYDEFGPNWELIARRMQRRTPGECARMLLKNASVPTDPSLHVLEPDHLAIRFDPRVSSWTCTSYHKDPNKEAMKGPTL